jgi:type III secretion protein R
MIMANPADLLPLIVVVLAIGVLPFAAMIITSYTKIVVVLGLLRQALGVQQVPPNIVLNGLALIVSAFIMAPLAMDTVDTLEREGVEGNSTKQVVQVMKAAQEPVRAFLEKHAEPREKAFFIKSAQTVWPAERAKALTDKDLIVLAPAFTLTELTAAFKIGFMLYLGFIVIDLVIANILLALGLSQVTPTQIAIPFKLLLFVAMDGWSVLIHGLITTYR